MRAVLGFALVALSSLACGLAADEKKGEKIDTEKLIGRWEPKLKQKGTAYVWEFAKDGKLVLTRTDEGAPARKFDGSYKWDGNKLTLTLKGRDGEESRTVTVAKVTDSELVIRAGKEEGAFLVRLKDK